MNQETRWLRWLRFLAGIFAPALLGLVVCLLYDWLHHDSLQPTARKGNSLIEATAYPNLFLVPILMGMVAEWIWRPLRLRLWVYFLGSLLITLVAEGGAFLFLGEGAACLVMGAPLFFAVILSGALLGRLIFGRTPRGLQVSFVPLLLLVALVDGRFPAQRNGVVTDEVVIRASVDKVWPHVVAFPPIERRPTYWLNHFGLPAPSATTCEGAFVGARRDCIFSNGLVFKEVVTELDPPRRLTFDIVEQPPDPELLGHVELHRGQFELVPNADGTTTLVGRSWYTLHVRPLWYFDWWTRDITREVHLRVMRHIKELAERRH